MIKYICLFALIATNLRAHELSGDFSSDILVVDKDRVHVISSFDEVDYLSTYSHSGDLVWEISFGSHILSWKMSDNDQLFVLSKSRNTLVFYLTCVEASTGKFAWEKSIVSPKNLSH